MCKMQTTRVIPVGDDNRSINPSRQDYDQSALAKRFRTVLALSVNRKNQCDKLQA